MLYRHVFDTFSTEFRGISRIYLNFAAPRQREISEALPLVAKFHPLFFLALIRFMSLK